VNYPATRNDNEKEEDAEVKMKVVGVVDGRYE